MFQMDDTDNKASVDIKVHNIVNEITSHSCPLLQQIPLTTTPTSILLHVLSSYGLEAKDLVALEAACTFFKRRANIEPDATLSLPEVAAYDTCCQKAIFKSMNNGEKERLKQRCGGSWKLLLMFLLISENYHRGKSQVVAGPGHSIVVTSKGDVYSFCANSSGQLGHGNTEEQFEPCLIRSLQGIRITQAAVGSRRTMLVSDTGRVYTFGQNSFAGLESVGAYTSTPKVVESLEGVFVVQASIGGYFSAVLSREGQVYTFCWGSDARLGHRSDPTDRKPRLLSGPLEDALVVQIAAGNCYLLTLVYQPTTGMSVYSLGCGQGGKLGHGCKADLTTPRKIQHFETLKVKPVSVAAGAFHCAVLASDGRVFTWGWYYDGCLGHDDEQVFLTAVPAGLGLVKARYVSAGYNSTFVITDNGDVYSFGRDRSDNLGVEEHGIPKLATRIVALDEKVVQISATNTWDWVYQNSHRKDCSHTLVLTESGRLYSLGAGNKGQLGVKLADGHKTRPVPDRVDIDDLA